MLCPTAASRFGIADAIALGVCAVGTGKRDPTANASGYHICNARSCAWHRSLGFKEIPEYFYCRLQAAWYRDRIWRQEKLGVTEQLEQLRTEKDRWEQLGKDLEPWDES